MLTTWTPKRIRRHALQVVAGWTVACLFLTTGCQQEPEMVPVNGTVLYQGKPLEYGSVIFQPVGGGDLARSRIKPDGSFLLTTKTEGDGVRKGHCRVRITAFDAQRWDYKATSNGDMMLGESAIPAKYQRFGTSGIEIEVAPDISQPVVIELK